jgi:hypothetical protein
MALCFFMECRECLLGSSGTTVSALTYLANERAGKRAGHDQLKSMELCFQRFYWQSTRVRVQSMLKL